VPISTVGPVHMRERIMAATFGVLHGQKRRKVVFFRVTRIDIQARKLELPP
jgi:hypothetical protein